MSSNLWHSYNGLAKIRLTTHEEYGAELIFYDFKDPALTSVDALNKKFQDNWAGLITWPTFIKVNFRKFTAIEAGHLSIDIQFSFSYIGLRAGNLTAADAISPIFDGLKEKFGAQSAVVIQTIKGMPGEVTDYFKTGEHVIVPSPSPAPELVSLLKWVGAGILIYELHRVLSLFPHKRFIRERY